MGMENMFFIVVLHIKFILGVLCRFSISIRRVGNVLPSSGFNAQLILVGFVFFSVFFCDITIFDKL